MHQVKFHKKWCLKCLTPVIQTVSNGRFYLLLLRQSTSVGFVWICCIIWCILLVSGMPSVPGAVPCRQTRYLNIYNEILEVKADASSSLTLPPRDPKKSDSKSLVTLVWHRRSEMRKCHQIFLNTIKRLVKQHQKQTAWKKAPYCLHGDGQMEAMIYFTHCRCIHPILLLLFLKRTDLKCLSRSLLQHGCIHWRWRSLMQTFN